MNPLHAFILASDLRDYAATRAELATLHAAILAALPTLTAAADAHLAAEKNKV